MIRSNTPIPGFGSDDEHASRVYGSNCEQVRLIEPYVSRRLRVQAQIEFEKHLFFCERCLRAVEFELFVKRAVSDITKFAEFSRSWH